METRKLLKFSLITTLLGLFLIIMLSNNLEPSTIKISDINENMIDEWASVQGNITNQIYVEGITILTVYDGTAGVNAIIYKELKNIEGSKVRILGKIIEYGNELEIEINKINIIE